ncbi:hypothetical protein B0H67DRAFT_558865 [Lasiosphaeris hirsuta]|uniref:Uncharacterized protein n=1 Tax=Lasiosphaeris hirsuta TaxID=260670 RepID=A0AA40B879_9PEZI|nr:hypothetical protein B0H67DRAFT_558865 [Lasiosphaeris hirsuta]
MSLGALTQFLSLKQISAVVAAVAIGPGLLLVLSKQYHSGAIESAVSNSNMASPSLPFDPLNATASDLQKLLDKGTVTSEDLVYLAQIEKHNRYGMRLNAIISTAPKDVILTAAARALDQERRASGNFSRRPRA